MKAVLLPGHGDVDVLKYATDFPNPEPGDGEVLIKIRAAGINNVDLVNRRGYPGISIPLPHILGADIAGEIEQTGNGESDFKAGDRVVVYPILSCGTCEFCRAGKENICQKWQFLGMHLKGGYAEYISVPARNIIPIPDSVSYEEAVCLPVAGLTAFHALKKVGQLKSGQTFFIWGGAGGLGSIAVQIAKQLGAVVLATAGSDEKLDFMKKLGADYVFDRHRDDVPSEIKKIAPNGVDMVVDYVGPQTFQTSLDLLKKGGRLIVFGILTGRETTLNIHMTYLRHLSIYGIYMGTKAEMVELLKWVVDGKIKSQTNHIFDLKEAADAHRLIEERKSMGKVVLRP